MRLLSTLITTSLLLASVGSLAQTTGVSPEKGGILKWVDEKGVTHYGDSIPPEYANRSNSVMNKSGRVVRNNEAFKATAQPTVDEELEKQLAEQQRRDSVLLASYTTEQEIDLAKERSTQMDESAIKGLEQRSAGVKERLAMHQKSAANFQSRKRPIPDDLKQDIAGANGELGRIEDQIAQKRKDIEETRIRFDRDKQRFHELKLMKAARPPVAPR
jgi:chromosome segregation ATPase